MKQLFLKSNILHIRTNEGEFEVSNPEVAYVDDEGYGWWAYGLNAREKGIVRKIGITRADTVPHDVSIEWPYGIELIDMLQIRVGNEWKNLLYQKEYKGNMESTRTIKLARLLPKEEKKHEWTTDDIMSMVEKKPAQPTPNFPKGGTTFTESDYKEFEGKEVKSKTLSTSGVRGEMASYPITPPSSVPDWKAFDAGWESSKDYYADKDRTSQELAKKAASILGPFMQSVESSEPQEKGHDCEFFLVTDVSVYACECDPHHILIDNQEYVAINKITKANPVSAPSESQEEMWNEVNEHINAQIGDYISLEAVKLSFILTRKPE